MGTGHGRMAVVLGVYHFCRWTDSSRGSGEGIHLERRGRVMPKRRTPEERYKENISKQQTILEEFAAYEIEWADDLLLW
jgi:hypothetical protein